MAKVFCNFFISDEFHQILYETVEVNPVNGVLPKNTYDILNDIVLVHQTEKKEEIGISCVCWIEDDNHMVIKYGAAWNDDIDIKFLFQASYGRLMKCGVMLLMEADLRQIWNTIHSLGHKSERSCKEKDNNIKKESFNLNCEKTAKRAIELCHKGTGVERIIVITYSIADNILLYGAGVWHKARNELLLECDIDTIDFLGRSANFRYHNFPVIIALNEKPKDLNQFLFKTVRRHGTRCIPPKNYYFII